MTLGTSKLKARTGPHYWPLADPVMVAFVLAVTLLAMAIALNVVSLAYSRLGLEGPWVLAILLGCIVGSWFNIPVARLGGDVVFAPTLVRVYGMTYVVPAWIHARTKIVAVNVGGAIIPTGLAAYLMWHDRLGWQALAATALVVVPVHAAARIVRGVGVVVPTLIPPVSAAFAAWVMHVPEIAALAYVSGTFGVLIGADLLNLRHITRMDAPVVSIGGAGTFDGIFVTGIVAVAITAL